MRHQNSKYIFILLLLLFGNLDSKCQTKVLNTKLNKSFISFRIGVPLWISETRCNELFDLFDKNKGVTDEITFFTSVTHAPLPLDVIKERTAILKERMVQARNCLLYTSPSPRD